jgi:hypothetical protein
MRKLIQLSTILTTLFFAFSCYLAAIYQRVIHNDGSRATFHLLDNSSVFFEHPYRRISNVIAQWPYLIYANLNPGIKIQSALEWISYSYSFYPFLFLIFFGVWGYLKKDFLWWWITFSLIPLIYLPQALNHFNTTAESAFVFILYMFVDSFERNKKNFCIKAFLLLSFYYSHETSVLYPLFICALPFIKKSNITRWVKAEVIVSFCTAGAILLAYYMLPTEKRNLFLDKHFETYFRDWTIWINHLGLFLLLLYPAINAKLRTLINVIFFIVVTFLFLNFLRDDFSFSSSYCFRLLTSYFTTLFLIIYIKRPNIFRLDSVKILILMMTLSWSLKDIHYSTFYKEAQGEISEYLKDKTGCVDVFDVEVTRKLARNLYIVRDTFAYTSMILSPSFERLHVVFIQDISQNYAPSCPTKSERDITITPGHSMWFTPNGRFQARNI